MSPPAGGSLTGMSRTICNVSVSLDGFLAGPDQSVDNPLGKGGLRVHSWHVGEDLDPLDQDLADRHGEGVGAYVMGRNMYGPVRGEWEGSFPGWRGWWGDDPPYHGPVFVLTHYPHEPIPMDGGTTFYFVTDGPESALAQAREAAGDLAVQICGGASTARQYLAAGEVDSLRIDLAPVVFGAGERLWDGLEHLRFEPGQIVATGAATHITYAVSVRPAG